jgi:hypothetical protein
VPQADLQAAVDLVAAVNAGVVQAIVRRGHEQMQKACAEACDLPPKK